MTIEELPSYLLYSSNFSYTCPISSTENIKKAFLQLIEQDSRENITVSNGVYLGHLKKISASVFISATLLSIKIKFLHNF
jgi:hypothetical protein